MRSFIATKNLFLFAFISISFNLFSQNTPENKKNYSLFWEITGNGLSKPSYLFGTMHLRDKRVFEFSDSMLLKLENCEAFATEVRMDSAVYKNWEMTMSGDTTNKLSRKLSKKGYERLLKALKAKGINLDSLDSKNQAIIQGKLTERSDFNTDDSKDLFLDLYLTRMAYNQGKSLHGLEKLDDYEDLNDSFFKQFEDSTFFQKDTGFMAILSKFTQFQDMIEVYNSGDLDALMQVVNDQKSFNGNQYKREMLDNRNVRMVQSMENLMHQKSSFCAVGAAHLPDTMGIIALLREKGYTVRKMTPQFTGVAEQYKVKKIVREKYHLKDDFNHIELDFPEEPYLMNKMNSNRRRLGAQYLYFDITTGAMHFAETDYNPTSKKISKEKTLTDAFNLWLSYRAFKDLKKEKITLGEHEGFEFTGRLKSKELVKGHFFVANDMIYKTIVFFDKDDDMERADAFLNSLKINPLPLTDWQVFEEPKSAFSIKMPTKPEFQEVKSNIEDDDGETLNYYSNIFISKEAKEGFTYMVRYSDMPVGRHIENDSSYLSKAISEVESRFKKLKATIETDSTTRHYGCPEYNLKITFDGITIFMRNILRGNRLYILLAQPPLEKNKVNNKKSEEWLNSFRFLPFNTPELTNKNFPGLGLNIGLPASRDPYKLTEEKATFPSKSESVIRTTDAQTSAVYFLSKTDFSKYYNAINADSFWNKFTRTLQSSGNEDIKVEIRDTLFKGLKAKLLTLDYLKSQNTFKSLVFLKDGYQYDISLILPYEIANDAYANTFYNSIELTENKEKADIFSSKKSLIINDLAASEDSICKAAKIAFKDSDWEKNDLPILIEALQKKYADDTLEYNSVRLNLLGQITVFKDVSTLNALEKLVKTTQQDTFIRNAVLCAFLDLDTLNSANRFFDIVKSLNQEDLSEFYCLNRFMTDSIERAKLYYAPFLSLSKEPFKSKDVIRISASLAAADTLHLTADIFKKWTPQYLDAANELMQHNTDFLERDTLGENDGDVYSLLYSYVRLFKNSPNSPEINHFLNKIAQTRQPDLLNICIQTLVKHKQPITNIQWQSLFKDKSNWFFLVSGLEEDSLLSAVPPQYLGQKDIVEGIILNYLEEDYGKPQAFNFIETQKYKGELLYVYKCKMDYGEEENNYLIVLCAQPINKVKFNLSPQLLLISEDLKDVKNYKKVVSDLLKNYEKNAELIKVNKED
jgi:uncharacterized protein YbaP (TraB family)